MPHSARNSFVVCLARCAAPSGAREAANEVVQVSRCACRFEAIAGGEDHCECPCHSAVPACKPVPSCVCGYAGCERTKPKKCQDDLSPPRRKVTPTHGVTYTNRNHSHRSRPMRTTSRSVYDKNHIYHHRSQPTRTIRKEIHSTGATTAPQIPPWPLIGKPIGRRHRRRKNSLQKGVER